MDAEHTIVTEEDMRLDSQNGHEPATQATRPTPEQRMERGRAARTIAPRGQLGNWSPHSDRPDPTDVLVKQAEGRLSELLPLRYGRMSASPFAYYRGAAAVMAGDLAGSVVSGIRAQLCGDAHISNFGIYGSPERAMLFDLNDFDETLPGPWEYDVKRMVASCAVAGRTNGLKDTACQELAFGAANAYRRRMHELAAAGQLEVWYSFMRVDEMPRYGNSKTKQRVSELVASARKSDQIKAYSKLTHDTIDGRRFIDQPPLLTRLDSDGQLNEIHALLHSYRATLPPDRAHLFDHYRFVDVARKVVGVGSVGTRCFVLLMEGRDGQDPLFLQVKEANRSVLEVAAPRSEQTNQGERVVTGQRLMQAASDIFLGWMRNPNGRDFYWRQLRDMKASVEIPDLTARELGNYVRLCGAALAYGHARSGDRVALATYLGNSDRFETGMSKFAMTYADQTERDHSALLRAIKNGRVPAVTGV